MALDRKTLDMLRSWEKKHGLDVLQEHLDRGLFSPNQEKRRLCYAWIARARTLQKVDLVGKWTACLGLIAAACIAMIAAFTE